MRRLSAILNALLDKLQAHPVAALSLVFLLGMSGMLLHLTQLSNQQLQASALKNAELITTALSEFRSLYASEVVESARRHGMTVTHDYVHKPGSIPLPATLSMLIGNRLGERGAGASTLLYSPYPFPWRKDTGGLRDEFAREAWAALQAAPDKSFHRIETRNGRLVLRYATADRMRAACVDCHNSHPDSPRRGWKLGDVRGILEVDQSLDVLGGGRWRSLAPTFVLLFAILGVLTGLLALVFWRLRLSAARDEELGREMTRLNKRLAFKVTELQKTQGALRCANDELKRLNSLDPLTELLNRWGFEEALDREWRQGCRHKRALAVLMADIDHFKAYNDHYGHQAGDDCLRRVAAALRQQAARPHDWVARYGGEEFVVVLGDTDGAGALKVAQAMCDAVRELGIEHAGSPSAPQVTLSLGVAALLPGPDCTPVRLVALADRALYQAKVSGRDRVVAADAAY
ncbi:MAG: diguanylate cyclase [Gammaproteobacteria bacterium]|nr:diguanylate cyclase [Gammaproteobacteria bacterium]